MDEVLQGERDAYRRGDMEVVQHRATFTRVMGLIKWGSLFLATFLTFFVIWLCTPASFFPSLVLAGIVAIAGGSFLPGAAGTEAVAGSRRVLVIGIDPDAVDFASAGLPPGVTAETVKAGLATLPGQFAARGLEADLCRIPTGPDAEAVVADQLAQADYGCVVIGGGVRVPPSNLMLFEGVINAVRRCAPVAEIAFNVTPQDTVEAALRRLDRD